MCLCWCGCRTARDVGAWAGSSDLGEQLGAGGPGLGLGDLPFSTGCATQGQEEAEAVSSPLLEAQAAAPYNTPLF